MRILMIPPKEVANVGDFYFFPLGIAYISAALKKEKFDVECLNLNNTDEPADRVIRREVVSKDIDIVGTGGLSLDYNMVKYILTAAKEAKKNVITIAGGGLVTSEPELMIKALPMDVGVIGEGEETIVELVRTLENDDELKNIKGIIYKDRNATIVTTPPREVIENPDNIPYPDYDGFEIEKYLDYQRPADEIFLYPFDKPRCIPMAASRSCPFNCTFCYHPLGRRYRQRSLDSFFEELRFLVKKYDINIVYILDELFAMDARRLNEFCDRMSGYNMNLKWTTSMRGDAKITSNTIAKLKDSGLFQIRYGLESASDKVLRSMNKHISFSQTEKTIALTTQAGISARGGFIFGDPAETLETARETLEWWRKHGHEYHSGLGRVIPYPGSAIYKYCLENKIIPDKLEYIEKGCPPVNMTKLTDDELASIFYKETPRARSSVIRRMVGKAVSVEQERWDEDRKTFLYTMKVDCPHCGNRIKYQHYHITLDQIREFLVTCRDCNQTFSLPSTIFHHIKDEIGIFRGRLLQLMKNGRPVSISPFVPKHEFMEFMQIFEFDFRKLNVKYFLDYVLNLDKTDSTVLYPILKRTRENIEEKCKDNVFIVMPYSSCKEIVRSFKMAGVNEQNIFYLAFK